MLLAGMANYDRNARRVTLETAAKEGKRLWLGCNGCGRNIFVPVEEFVGTSGVSILTPHKLVARRLRCTRCGSRDCFCTIEPYSGPSTRGAAQPSKSYASLEI
jgi:hypothetical protein